MAPLAKKPRQLDPAEKLFLDFINKYTIENIRDAIIQDIDLGRLVVEEFGDDGYLNEVRNWVNLYDTTHPGARARLADPIGSARAVLEWLKVQRPDLGFEIENWSTLPTVGSAGFVVVGPGQEQIATQPPIDDSHHVGIQWLAKNIVSLAEVLIG